MLAGVASIPANRAAAKSPPGTGSTDEATGTTTTPCTPWCAVPLSQTGTGDAATLGVCRRSSAPASSKDDCP